jgi:hypothetical protein
MIGRIRDPTRSDSRAGASARPTAVPRAVDARQYPIARQGGAMKAAAILAPAVVAAAISSGVNAQYLWQARDAEQARAAAASTQSSAPAQQGSGSGLMIFIDPATKQIRPAEQEDFRALIPPRLATEAVAAPQVFVAPSGAMGVRLDPSFDSYMLAVKRPDGTLAFDCVEGRAQGTPAPSSNATRAHPGTSNARLDEK